MAKRFIDTGLFDDSWFMELSSDSKIFWIYCLTKCDHAGIIKLNRKLCQVQTDIKSLDTVIKELGNRLLTLNKDLFFIPKFISYQYPGFPRSGVRQQQGALEILKKYNLIDEESLRLKEELGNSYGYGNDNGYVNGKEKEVQEKKPINISFESFWDLYDKKRGDKTKLEKKWNNLNDDDRSAIMDFIPRYIIAQPDKLFRKDPETFLNNRSWNDEIINRKINGSESLPEDPVARGIREMKEARERINETIKT